MAVPCVLSIVSLAHVRVSAEPAEHCVVVRVDDDGAGSEVGPHLFESFATAAGSGRTLPPTAALAF